MELKTDHFQSDAPRPTTQTRDSDPLLALIFRIGFASVFLINAAIAVVDPGGFVKLMQGSFLGGFVRDFSPFVWMISLNDFVIGVLVLSGRWRTWVLAWSGLWLLAVTLIKFSDLLT
jgi:uncharacterized membrane protein YphA (DoxX/SURF4 family)